MNAWIRRQPSTIFAALLFVSTAVVFLAGLYFMGAFVPTERRGQAAIHSLGVVLVNLSAIGVAAAVTTVFFSFRDVQNFLAESVAQLFSEGEAVNLLGPPARSTLHQRLTARAVGSPSHLLNPSLYNHINRVTQGSLGEPITSQMHFALTMSDHVLSGYRKSHLVSSYRIHTGHLGGITKHPVMLYRSILLPLESGLSIEEWFEDATIAVGGIQLDRSDITFSSELGEGSVRYQATLRHMIDLTSSETDVVSEVTTVTADSDPSAHFFTRYASSGFSATVVRDTDHLYDASWFLYCAPAQDTPASGSIHTLPNGISARTNDWVLPGEGVAITFRRRTSHRMGS